MITCAVGFDGDDIHINGYKIDSSDGVFVCRGLFVSQFESIEQAIKYCVEN